MLETSTAGRCQDTVDTRYTKHTRWGRGCVRPGQPGADKSWQGRATSYLVEAAKQARHKGERVLGADRRTTNTDAGQRRQAAERASGSGRSGRPSGRAQKRTTARFPAAPTAAGWPACCKAHNTLRPCSMAAIAASATRRHTPTPPMNEGGPTTRHGRCRRRKPPHPARARQWAGRPRQVFAAVCPMPARSSPLSSGIHAEADTDGPCCYATMCQ